MRSAIRGDFERLAERRGGQELMREPEQDTEPAPAEPEPEPASEGLLEYEEPSEELLAAAEDPAPEQPPRRSLLDRLLGR